MVWQRARRPEQKEQRRLAILEAAAALFTETGLDGVSLNAIARRARVSKANVYRYFQSREEIFLHLLLSDQRRWVADVESRLLSLAGGGDIDAVAAALSESIFAHPRLASLASVTATVLERNVTAETVLWFKTAVLELSSRLGLALMTALPELTPDTVRDFLLYSHFFTAGLWPNGHPPPVVADIVAREEFSMFRVDAREDTRRGLTYLLRGILAT